VQLKGQSSTQTGLGERDLFSGLMRSCSGDFLAGEADLRGDAALPGEGERRRGEGERLRGDGERRRGDGERRRGEGERRGERNLRGERERLGLLLPGLRPLAKVPLSTFLSRPASQSILNLRPSKS